MFWFNKFLLFYFVLSISSVFCLEEDSSKSKFEGSDQQKPSSSNKPNNPNFNIFKENEQQSHTAPNRPIRNKQRENPNAKPLSQYPEEGNILL